MNTNSLAALLLIIFFVFISTSSVVASNINFKSSQSWAQSSTDTTDSKGPLFTATFIVDEAGNLGKIKIQKTECEPCSKEQKKEMEQTVKNLIKEKKWKPGDQNGRPVKVKYTLPVRFEIVGDSLILPTKEK